MNRRSKKRSYKRKRKSTFKRRRSVPRPILKPDGMYVEKIVRTFNWVNGTGPQEGVNQGYKFYWYPGNALD